MNTVAFEPMIGMVDSPHEVFIGRGATRVGEPTEVEEAVSGAISQGANVLHASMSNIIVTMVLGLVVLTAGAGGCPEDHQREHDAHHRGGDALQQRREGAGAQLTP